MNDSLGGNGLSGPESPGFQQQALIAFAREAIKQPQPGDSTAKDYRIQLHVLLHP